MASDVYVSFGGDASDLEATLATGAFVAILAAFLPIDVLLLLVNMGTLLAFVLVCGAVLVMRRTHPSAARPFRAPLVPLVPLLGIGSCLMLMFSLPAVNWLRLFVWLGIGLLIYFTYGRRHSHLTGRRAPPTIATVAAIGTVISALVAGSAHAQGLTLPPDCDNQKAVAEQWIGPVEISISYHSPKITSPTGEDESPGVRATVVSHAATLRDARRRVLRASIGACGSWNAAHGLQYDSKPAEGRRIVGSRSSLDRRA